LVVFAAKLEYVHAFVRAVRDPSDPAGPVRERSGRARVDRATTDRRVLREPKPNLDETARRPRRVVNQRVP